ncbi:TorF family putative porin [Pelobacter propionicus]|uniref:MltA-interacting MipA family protein n=1 Tax=Pelobacter propionicus (strain DSM 2379 / NBRC 103807 / OttBd1) TaxID=338966 RepID=A1ANB0_PELPD|nr:hypothetical protein [Pelobacter propionicus]ABK98830.1 conserved hypothetical protein [Pelobacter propionicus DSM 2379]
MKASLRTLALSLMFAVGMGVGTYAHAQDAVAEPAPPAGYKLIPEDLTADLNVSLYTQYVWRGYALSKDSLVIFPTLTVGYKGFAFNVWTDLDTDYDGLGPAGDSHNCRLWETDYVLTYSNSYEPWKLNYTLGWIYYDTDGTDGLTPTKSQELFVTLGLDTLLKPTFSVFQEIETGHAWYFQLGLSHSLAVYKDWSLDLAGTVSYLNNKSTNDFSDFHDGNISAGLKIPLNKYLSITPKIQYSFPLSSAASKDIEAGSLTRAHNFVYGGIIFDLAI